MIPDGIGGDSKTRVDWINGHAKQKTTTDGVRSAQIQLRDWWSTTGWYTSSVSTTKMLTPAKKTKKNDSKNCMAQGHWIVRVLVWELSLRRMRKADQDFHGLWGGPRFTRIVGRYLAGTLLMLRLEVAPR